MKWKIGNFTTELLFGRKEEQRENPNLLSEEEILEEYIKNFDYDLKIVHNSDNYTTVQYKDYDLFRLKFGIGKWVEICMPTKIKKKYIDNPLFVAEPNKNRVFWKARIDKPEDLDNFIDIIKENIDLRNKLD